MEFFSTRCLDNYSCACAGDNCWDECHDKPLHSQFNFLAPARKRDIILIYYEGKG
jgi:hypothetical protein